MCTSIVFTNSGVSAPDENANLLSSTCKYYLRTSACSSA